MNEIELNHALTELRADQHKYTLAYALSSGLSMTEALAKSHRSKGWFYGLPEEEQKQIIEVASELSASPFIKSKLILDNAVVKAAEVKVSGLDSRNENIKQNAASEILDRTIGKTEQPISGEVSISVTIKKNDTLQD